MNVQKVKDFQSSKDLCSSISDFTEVAEVVNKVQFALETLTFESDNDEKIIQDFFELIKVTGNYPITPLLRNLVEAQNEVAKVKGVIKLLDHLTYKREFYFFGMILGKLGAEDSSASVMKLILQYLTELEEQPEFPWCSNLKKIALEENTFVNIKNILDFFYLLYLEEKFLVLKKAYEHFFSLDSNRGFYQFLGSVSDSPFLDAVSQVSRVADNGIIKDAFSSGQIKSKLWLVETFDKLDLERPKNLLILCGWYSLLSAILSDQWKGHRFERVRSIDLDPSCERIADKMNHALFTDSWRFKSVTMDIQNIEWVEIEGRPVPYIPMENKYGKTWTENEPYDLLVNTSCEHLDNFEEWYASIPVGQLMVLQTNDYFDCEGHVNCVNSTAEFRDQTPMSRRLFSGALPLDLYTRYMTIGYR